MAVRTWKAWVSEDMDSGERLRHRKAGRKNFKKDNCYHHKAIALLIPQ